MFFEKTRQTDCSVYGNAIQQNGKQNIYIGILGTDGQQRRQGSGADKQRKHDRDKRGIAGNVRTFADQINIQYHFQTEQKDYQRTGNRKRGNVQPEQFQKRFAGIKEEYQQHQRIDKCAAGADFYPLVLQVYHYRQIARDIRNSQQDNKRA